ncbi:peroxiredoxin [Enterococcus faecalis]|nr:peroxiredoxin [Enterococcus faecalis]
MSLINTQVVPFKVQAYKEGKFIEVTDADLRGHWSVFVFYPADFTFVCPTELEDLADLYDEFKKINCEIYSVSTDTHFTHKAWAEASPAIKKVRYPMLGDPAQKLARAFDVLIEEEGLALRGTFIIDPNGVIKGMEVNDNSIGR